MFEVCSHYYCMSASVMLLYLPDLGEYSMDMWIKLLILCVAFLILEMFTPVMFFINLSIAALCASAASYMGYSATVVTVVFVVVSIVAILFVRPLFLKNMKSKNSETGMGDKYIGKSAKVVEEVTHRSGRVAIYGEEWNAVLKSSEEAPVPVGGEVKIVSNDSIILTVEEVKE